MFKIWPRAFFPPATPGHSKKQPQSGSCFFRLYFLCLSFPPLFQPNLFWESFWTSIAVLIHRGFHVQSLKINNNTEPSFRERSDLFKSLGACSQGLKPGPALVIHLQLFSTHSRCKPTQFTHGFLYCSIHICVCACHVETCASGQLYVFVLVQIHIYYIL